MFTTYIRLLNTPSGGCSPLQYISVFSCGLHQLTGECMSKS